MKHRLLLTLDIVAVIALAVVFLLAAGFKLRDPAAFGDQIYGFQLLPTTWIAPVAIILPWWEALAAIGLFIPRLRQASALLLAGMLIGFIIAALSVIARGLEIPCGCFGPSSRIVGWSLIFQDVGLLLAAVWLLCRPVRHPVEQCPCTPI